MSYTVNGKEYDTFSAANQRIIDKLVNREVFCCMTQEMEYILSRVPYNDAENPFDESVYDDLYAMRCGECGSASGFTEIKVGDLKDEEFQKYVYGYTDDDEEEFGFLCPVCGVCRDTIEEARDCCGEHVTVYRCDNCGAVFSDDVYATLEGPEIYEWWAVSGWFGEKLKEKGQIVIESWGKSYWGRQCTGQSISLDSVVIQIASDMGILEGMENDWVARV